MIHRSESEPEKTNFRLVFMGTGTSSGVPVITCNCGVCCSHDFRDKRSRVSLLVKGIRARVLLDISPDFRQQALTADLERLDAIFVTHPHYDHISGLDDIRIFNFRQQSSIPVYGNANTLDDIRRRFSYIFENTQNGGGKPDIQPITTEYFSTYEIDDIRIESIPLWHGELMISGYIVNDHTAFLTDCSALPSETRNRLHRIPRLIIGALRSKEHPTHFSYDQASQAISELRPAEAWFIHMSHELSHIELESKYGHITKIPFDNLEIGEEK